MNRVTAEFPVIQKDPAEYVQMALEIIEEIKSSDAAPDEKAHLFIKAGKMFDLSGDWDQALESYQRALELCEGDEVRAEALKQTGHIRSKRCEWRVALESYEASLAILNSIGDVPEAGNVYNSIGYNYFEAGNMDKAEEYYDRALQMAHRCNDIQLKADIQDNLGTLSSVRGQLDEAVKYYQQSMLGYEACNDKHGLAQLYNNLAMAYINKEDWTLAGEYYRRSMDLCVELGDMDFLSILYINRARLALHLYDLSTAEAYCDRALDTFSRTGNRIGEAQAYKVYGMVYSNLQEWYSAAAAFKTGIEICTEYGNYLTKAEILYELGVMMHKGDEKGKALQHLQESLEIYESLGIDEEAARIRGKMEKMRQKHQTWC